MRKRVLWVAVLSLSVATFAGEEPELTSPKAQDAAKAFAAAVTKLDVDYDAKVDAARTSYLAALKEAERAAGTAGNVDETVRIDARVKELEERAGPADAPAKHEPLVIDSAFIWAGDIKKDVTADVRARVSHGVLHGVDVAKEDLKYGFAKWMIIKSQFHSETLWFTVGTDFSKFSLGAELTKDWQTNYAAARKVD